MNKILIVDDSAEILEILEWELKKRNFDVFKTDSGFAAIEILKMNLDFKIVVSDFKMPNGDGKLVLDYIHRMQKKPIFYFFSSYVQISSEEAMSLGVRKIYVKPTGLKLLLKDIENFENLIF